MSTADWQATLHDDSTSIPALLASIGTAMALRCLLAGVTLAIVFVITVRAVVTVEGVVIVLRYFVR